MTNINYDDAHKSAIEAVARMAAAKSDLDAAKAILATKGSGRHTTVHGTFTVSENNTYSEQVMVAALKPGQFQRASKRVLDREKVKALYPHIYAAAKSRVGFKVAP